MFKEIKKGLIQGFVIVLVLAVSGISYAAFSNILTASDGEQLTSGKWNEIVNRLNSIDEKQLATAWVNFDGNTCPGGNCGIQSSYNVSSVVRLSTGRYQVNFTNPMDNDNYSIVAANSLGNGASSVQIGQNFTTHAILDNNYAGVSTQYDTLMNVIVFGGKN